MCAGMSADSTPTVDFHAHALIEPVEELVRDHPQRAAELTQQLQWQGEASARHNLELFASSYMQALTSLEHRLVAMDAMGVDVQAVSLSPTQYYYWADRDLADRIVRTANGGIAELCARAPQRLVGLATVSLQHPDLAADQLTHAVRELGLRGVQISPRVDTSELDDPRFAPLWGAAEALGAVIFIHPLGCTLGTRLASHYLSNVVGQPLETTVALSHLICGGVLERHPALHVCAAHGGGYLPQYIGRTDHAAEVRPECTVPDRPSSYLGRIFYDSLVYDAMTLRHLIERVGSSQVVLGTDYPFDMGVSDPLARLDAVPGLDESRRREIRGATAARLLKLPGHG